MLIEQLNDHGTCRCRGTYDRRRVEVRMIVAGDQVVFADVPQGVCPRCGSRVYKLAELEILESVMKERPLRSAAGPLR